MSPAVMASRPAIMRNSVDLLQPEAPTRTMNSPSATSRSMSCITATLSKRLATLRMRTDAMGALLFDGAERESAHDEALPERHQDHGRDGRDDRRRGHLGVLDLVLLREQRDGDRHGGELARSEIERDRELVPAEDEREDAGRDEP